MLIVYFQVYVYPLRCTERGMIRRRYRENDSFFDDGDLARFLFQSKAVPISADTNKSESEGTGDEHSMMLEDVAPKKKYICTQINCQACFSDFDAFDYHANTAHMHRCIVCCRDFHNSRLLDIHVTEKHDSYFEVLSKREPSYVCLVEGCDFKFSDDWERRRHLQQVHKYPKSYNFHNPTQHKRTVAKKSKEKEITKRGELKSSNEKEESTIIEMVPNSDLDVDMDKDTKHATKEKKKGKDIIGKDKQNEKGMEEGDGMDIDELTSCIAKVRIPKNITFGGRGRGGKRRGKML